MRKAYTSEILHDKDRILFDPSNCIHGGFERVIVFGDWALGELEAGISPGLFAFDGSPPLFRDQVFDCSHMHADQLFADEIKLDSDLELECPMAIRFVTGSLKRRNPSTILSELCAPTSPEFLTVSCASFGS